MTTLSNANVVIVGCGRMGSALAQGAVNAGAIDPSRLYCVDTDTVARDALASKLTAHVGEPSDGKSVWVIAVKPQYVTAAVATHNIKHGDVVISVAAGVGREAIKRALPGDASVVRAMPNTPALIGAGITGVLADTAADRELADALFGAVGEVVHLASESQFDAVTALSGSGPAYVFVAIEALADGGVAMGLPRETAMLLAKQTVFGAAALAKAENVHVAELKDRVASPGGTTIAGLAALEKAGFRSALIDAVCAATLRSRELGS